ncbi:hypothetical protein ACROYT_G014750 [Oculina patagonica]
MAPIRQAISSLLKTNTLEERMSQWQTPRKTHTPHLYFTHKKALERSKACDMTFAWDDPQQRMLSLKSKHSTIYRSLFFPNAVSNMLPDFTQNQLSFAIPGRKWKSDEESQGEEAISDGAASLSNLSSNLGMLFPSVKQREHELWRELHDVYLRANKHPLGAVYVFQKTQCHLCKKPLAIKALRISEVVMYDEIKGTFLASKIPKSVQ